MKYFENQNDVALLLLGIFPIFTLVYIFTHSVWAYLAIFSAPLLVLPTKVERSAFSHVVNILASVALTDIFTNLTWQKGWFQDLLQSFKCAASGTSLQSNPNWIEACRLTFEFWRNCLSRFLVFFLLPVAAMYVGFWEGLWRTFHRRKIIELDYQLKAENFIFAVIIFPLVLALIYGLISVIYRFSGPFGAG